MDTENLLRRIEKRSVIILFPVMVITYIIAGGNVIFPLSIMIGGLIGLGNLRLISITVSGVIGHQKAKKVVVFLSIIKLSFLILILYAILKMQLLNILAFLFGFMVVTVIMIIEGIIYSRS
ncbi:MAG: ATP synthase subunit I [Nitrospirota bacterium]